eukprot:3505491-Karenia_brevis.AAC.1
MIVRTPDAVPTMVKLDAETVQRIHAKYPDDIMWLNMLVLACYTYRTEYDMANGWAIPVSGMTLDTSLDVMEGDVPIYGLPGDLIEP